MIGLFGNYQVLVAGAGVTGLTAAIGAARAGAGTLLLESSASLGGMITAGRLSKPTGPVEGGVFLEAIKRAADYGGADPSTRTTSWGRYTGIFDAEVMQRVVLEMLEESGVEILLHATVTDVIADQRVRGLEVLMKSGRKVILADAIVDSTGDGDVAALAGAQFALGRPSDGATQPITSYFRVINVDVSRMVDYIQSNPQEFDDIVVPEPDEVERDRGYAFKVNATGYKSLIAQARSAGDYRLPKDTITVKTGLLPGEINVNATRFHGNALDDRVLTHAELEVRKQAYNAFDFLKKYVPGFEQAVFLEVAPRLGVRETRRIVGDYVLTINDVRSGSLFPDSIALAKAPIDIHEPRGDRTTMTSVGDGYTIPYRCLLPSGVESLVMAGRCISVDEVAFGSTRNVPVCALTGEAAGIAAALAAQTGQTPREVDIAKIQSELRRRGIRTGVE